MTIGSYGFRFPLILANVSTGDRVGFIHVLWETLSSYIKKNYFLTSTYVVLCL